MTIGHPLTDVTMHNRSGDGRGRIHALRQGIGQEQVVLGIAVLLAIVFAFLLPGFASIGNTLALLRSISVLGILALGMAVVVLGRGVDLSLIAIALVSAGLTSTLLIEGTGMPLAILAGFALAVGMGVVNGALVASLGLPALLVTIASALVFVGLSRITIVTSMITPIPSELENFLALGRNWHGVPVPLIVFGVLALLLHLFLRFTIAGRFIYAHGDNPEAARLTGIRVGALTVLEYVLCAIIGFAGGLVMTASTGMVNLRATSSTLVFDVLMVVILGGVSLTGGRGGVLSILAGVLLIGVLLNGMTIMDLNYYLQNIIKGAVLLLAIILDNLLHPRDEETARQGD